MKERKPILVTGLVRFGTSWTGEMISIGNEVCQLFEPFHPDHSNVFGTYDIDYHFLDEGFIDDGGRDYIKGILKSKYFILNELMSSSNIRDVIRVIYRYMPSKISAVLHHKSVLVKDPYAFFLAEFLYKNYNFSNVVLIRHPVAFVESFTRNASWDRHSICNSILQQNTILTKYKLEHVLEDLEVFAKEELAIKAESREGFDNKVTRYKRAALIWNIFAKVYLHYRSNFDWVFVKYEDLASDPLGEFRSVYSQLGLEFTQYHQDGIDKYTSPGNKVKSNKFVDLKRDSKSLVRSWEQRMSLEDISYIKEKTKEYGETIYGDEF